VYLARKVLQSPSNLVGLARDKQLDPVVLATQLGIEVVFELVESRVWATRYRYGRGLVSGGVHLDVVL
jgi:hypothetical protein